MIHFASTGSSLSCPPKPPENKIPPTPVSKKRTLWRGIVLLALLVVILVPGLAAYTLRAPLPLAGKKTVVIPRGTTVRDIAIKLQFEGVAPNRLAFRAAARYFAGDQLKAGEYEFTSGQSLVDAVIMMRDGKSVTRLFTVAEGLTSAEVVRLLNNEQALSGEVPSSAAEGSLLPETYGYMYGDSRNALIERMQNDFRRALDELWQKRDPSIPLASPQEAVVMASIVEKETGKKAEERARVAGVFYNRLRKGMRLQSDPTVIYALTHGSAALGRELSRNDLACDSPYNTYVIAGLPPGPICNPGRAAIEATLHPEKHDYLYFVADGTGGHAFARDLEEHNKNVKNWQCLPKNEKP